MDHTRMMSLCSYYIAGFFALLSLTPLGTFPPPNLTFVFPGFSSMGLGAATYDVPWAYLFGFVLLVCLGIVLTIAVLGSVQVLGSGVQLDVKYVSTLIVGTILSAFMGYTMMAMFPAGFPFILSIFIVWIPIFLLVYSLYMGAGKA